jgi:hypothetical protein
LQISSVGIAAFGFGNLGISHGRLPAVYFAAVGSSAPEEEDGMAEEEQEQQASAVPKKSTAKRTKRKTAGRKSKRTKRVAKPMTKAVHDVAAEVAGLFATRMAGAGFAVSIRESKNKDALMATARTDKERVSLRLGQR